MGIIAIGFGIGGAVGIFGALLHILNHAVTKSLMFFGAGNILLKFKTKNIDEVKGIATLMPWTAAFFVAGALAITGSPPFSIFISEIIILIAGITSGNLLVSILYLLLLVVIFAGFMYHVGRMAFGEPAPGLIKGEPNYLGLGVMAVLLIAALALGIYVPLALSDVLAQIVAIFGGSA
jgi:hydrogenase-4 component F